jgi:3-oxoacyl-[acyl-carrier protein] reductase
VLRLLINNAGLIDEAEVPLREADPDQWWDVVSSHVKGGFLLCRAVVPWMVLRNRSRIVNLASGMSVRARPEYSAYSVAKTGHMRMTEALAQALEGSDVRVFDVSPGVVDTAMTRSMAMWIAECRGRSPGCRDHPGPTVAPVSRASRVPVTGEPG